MVHFSIASDNRFAVLDNLPMTSTGKIDRQALRSIVPERPTGSHTVPGANLEGQVARIWEEVLGLEGIAPDDNFFDLGGNSLDAMRLAERVESVFGGAFAPAWLFETPTISSMVERIRAPERVGLDPALAAVQVGGSRPPFFCASPPNVDVMAYRHLAEALGKDQPFYALYNPGKMHPGHGAEALRAEASRYLSAVPVSNQAALTSSGDTLSEAKSPLSWPVFLRTRASASIYWFSWKATHPVIPSVLAGVLRGCTSSAVGFPDGRPSLRILAPGCGCTHTN
jgi:acyl carrier protein